MLELPLIDYVSLSRAGGTDTAPVYVASIQFPRYKMTSIDIIQVLCCELPDQPIQCLIGRDILSRWQITYNGRTGVWSIEEEASSLPMPLASQSSLASDSFIDKPSVMPKSAIISPWVEPSEGTSNDVFVSHASEDKDFVEPLVSALKAAGIRVWYDKDRMKWGDNLRSSIDEGLLNSRFGVVILSKAFFKKKRWTEHELNGLFAKERDGKKTVLPIWHKITQDDLAQYSASFVDRLALDSQKNSIGEIVRDLKLLLEQKS